MLYQVSDFTGEYRLDTNVVTQTDYQQAIDAHELALLREYFDEASVQKILAAAPSLSAPAAYVRNTLREVAIPFIFHRIRMGIQGTLPAEPTTQGHRAAPIPPRIFKDAVLASARLRLYAPYLLRETFASPSDTFSISPADTNVPLIVSVGDNVVVEGVGTYQVVSVTPTSVQISATLPPGDYVAYVHTVKVYVKPQYLTI